MELLRRSSSVCRLKGEKGVYTATPIVFTVNANVLGGKTPSSR